MHVRTSAKTHCESIMNLFDSPTEILLEAKKHAEQRMIEWFKNLPSENEEENEKEEAVS